MLHSAADEFDSHCGDIASIVHAALAGVKQDWNSKSSAITCVLPPEALVECFSWLEDVHDRVSVTCVSRSWRTIALASPHVWSNIDIGIRKPGDISLMQLLIQRASARPLTLSISIQSIAREEAVLQSLYDTRGHIRHLTVNSFARLSLAKLQHHDQIRGLYLGEFSIVDVTRPFLHLVSLHACIRGEDMSGLFKVCPNLVELALSGFCDVALFPVRPIPPSLTRLSLYFGNDLSRYLNEWSGHRLSTLDLMGPQQLTLAIAHVDFIIDGLEIHHLDVHITSSPSENRKIIIHKCEDNRGIALLRDHPAVLRPKIGQLRRLSLVKYIHILADARLDLPALEELTIEDMFFSYELFPSTTVLRLPSLRILTLLYVNVSAKDFFDQIQTIADVVYPTEHPICVRILEQSLASDTGNAETILEVLGLEMIRTVTHSEFLQACNLVYEKWR